MDILVLLVIVSLAEGFLHYFPWRLVLRRELPRLVAYVLGVLGLMVPFIVWLLFVGQHLIAGVLGLVIVTGGFAVMACYTLDWIVSLAWDKRGAEERERELMLQVLHAEK